MELVHISTGAKFSVVRETEKYYELKVTQAPDENSHPFYLWFFKLHSVIALGKDETDFSEFIINN